MANDEDLALQLHKQLNAIPLRARRGHGQELAHQPSLDRLKRDKGGGGKPRTKRTTSSSQEHPSSKKQRRTSDPDEHGHTSAQQRPVKRETTDSDAKPCDSRDSGMQLAHAGGRAQLEDVDPLQSLAQHSTAVQKAAVVAAHAAKRLAKQQQQAHGSEGRVKVFFAGVRWGLSLPHAAVKSRAALAKCLNDALVGEILSVGQGEGLSVIFLDARGGTHELGPTKWGGGGKASATRWRALAQSAARIYVRPQGP